MHMDQLQETRAGAGSSFSFYTTINPYLCGVIYVELTHLLSKLG